MPVPATCCHSHTRRPLTTTTKLWRDRVGYALSQWFRDPARPSTRTVQQIRVVAASATTKCSVASEPAKKTRRALACPLFPVCLAGNSRILRDIAEDQLKVTTNEAVRHRQRVDVGSYLRR